MQKTDWIWRNGEWVRWDDATVHVSAHALHYGSSVFEGIRAYSTPDGPAILCLEPHVRRLFNSCKIARMEMPYTPEQVSSAIVEHRGHATDTKAAISARWSFAAWTRSAWMGAPARWKSSSSRWNGAATWARKPSSRASM